MEPDIPDGALIDRSLGLNVASARIVLPALLLVVPTLYATFVPVGEAAYFFASSSGASSGALAGVLVLVAAVVVFLALAFALALTTTFREPWRKLVPISFELLYLVLLPIWGFAINYSLDECVDACQDTVRAVTGHGGFIVGASYLIGLLAYGVGRVVRRPAPVALELPILAGLGVGLLVTAALIVQFNVQALMGVLFAAVGLPLIAPLVAFCAFALLAARRLHALGRPEVGAGAAALTAITAGFGAVVASAMSGFVGLYGGALGQTCGWGFSVITPPPADCHYLCTVAAQGHPWLVRPLRLGRRRGYDIVVNRQLAVANAFEDLLHERWPRFGALARRVYDALAWDASRRIRSVWVADALFIAMLPAQALFTTVLWAFDRSDPEERIGRMYR